jgi:hypothetical protein
MTAGSTRSQKGKMHKGAPAWIGRRWVLLAGLLLVLAGSLIEAVIEGAPRRLPSVGAVPPIGAVKQAVSPPVMRPASGAAVVPQSAIRSARLADLPSLPHARPVWIRIPSMGLRASITPVGVDASTGIMDVPASVRTLGWYRFGAAPGTPGVTLIVGHVDSSTQGRGAFFALSTLRPGAAVSVRSSDGSSRPFVIVAVRSYPKAGLPARLFARTGPPVLALVTCGGAFNRVTRHYADNVVAYGVPVAPNRRQKQP